MGHRRAKLVRSQQGADTFARRAKAGQGRNVPPKTAEGNQPAHPGPGAAPPRRQPWATEVGKRKKRSSFGDRTWEAGQKPLHGRASAAAVQRQYTSSKRGTGVPLPSGAPHAEAVCRPALEARLCRGMRKRTAKRLCRRLDDEMTRRLALSASPQGRSNPAHVWGQHGSVCFFPLPW